MTLTDSYVHSPEHQALVRRCDALERQIGQLRHEMERLAHRETCEREIAVSRLRSEAARRRTETSDMFLLAASLSPGILIGVAIVVKLLTER